MAFRGLRLYRYCYFLLIMSSIHNEIRVWRKHLRDCALEDDKNTKPKGHMNFGEDNE